MAGIPPEVFDYRLGNRSALEWVIDQYRVTEDPRTGIRPDPNRADDPEYIVRLVGQVVRVSLETVKIVTSLPGAILDLSRRFWPTRPEPTGSFILRREFVWDRVFVLNIYHSNGCSLGANCSDHLQRFCGGVGVLSPESNLANNRIHCSNRKTQRC